MGSSSLSKANTKEGLSRNRKIKKNPTTLSGTGKMIKMLLIIGSLYPKQKHSRLLKISLKEKVACIIIIFLFFIFALAVTAINAKSGVMRYNLRLAVEKWLAYFSNKP